MKVIRSFARENGRNLLWSPIALLIAMCALSQVAKAESVLFATTDPEIEMWFYPTTSSNGLGSVRDRGSTFATYSYLDDNNEQQFHGGSGFDPTRRGSTLVAANTSAAIPRLDDPARYRIDSISVTVTLMGGLGEIVYDDTPEDMVELTTAGGDDPGNPIELWGVGFDDQYTTFGFQGEAEPEYFNEGDRRWPMQAGAFSGPYQVYAIDPNGNDVENAVFGGYTATGENNETEQFTPTPFGIGKAYDALSEELAPGTALGAGTELEFAIDLANPGVVSYLQNSLSAGHLGFFVSSLHEPLAHTGEIAYPDYYLDNNPAGPNPLGNAPTIELVVTILDDLLAGDYDASGVVDELDYGIWKSGFGSAVEAGSGADGNGDGMIGAADYSVWRDAFDASSAAGMAGGLAVPEPEAAMMLLIGAVGSMVGRRKWRCISCCASPSVHSS